jgi:pimeloyl-ACP methyl ester carboxylesterase
MRPFQQLRFEALPEEPRIPHDYARMRAHEVVVRSRALGDVRTHVRELGEGPPLLLVHGLMTTSYSWRWVVGALARRFRVIAPDLPGCGRSEKPLEPVYSASNMGAFLGELAGALDVRGCPVVGNSLGGFLAMRMVLDDPGAASRLLVIHSPIFPQARYHALRTALAVPGTKRLLLRVIRRDPERWAHRNVHYFDETRKSREEAREYGAPLATEEGAMGFVKYLAETVAPEGFATLVRDLAARHARGAAFPVPLALVYARRDPMVPPWNGERLARLVPGAQIEWLEDSSHFPQVDSPERLVELVERWVDRH